MRRLAAWQGGGEVQNHMARKVIGPTGSRRRRWLLLLCLATTASLAVVFIPGALANSVKAQTFELDGNIAQTHPAAPTTYDWANFFDSSGAKSPALPDASRAGYTASSFVRDFNTTPGKKGAVVFDTSDASTYTVGSKDILDVNGWSCTPANNVTDKGDIMNAYAVAYTDSVSGHKFMFFALERNANAGDANVAFWFLQGSATCPAAGGSFSGSHHNGDLLIVSAFTNGGSVSTINGYEWQNGALNTTPVANGGDCSSTTLNGDPICATSNTTSLSSIPWLTENKADGVGHTLQTGEFFEGGIDLSAPSVNLANNCFNTFVPDTRSSQSLTATLYDYALGQLGECQTILSTTAGDSSTVPENNGGVAGTAAPTSIGGGSVSSGSDTAALQVTGVGSWSGTLSFFLCGPFSSTPSGAPKCDRTLGVPAGSANVSESDNNAHNFVSNTLTLTSVGTYCWTAHFEPSTDTSNNGVSAKDDSGASECFTVGKATPSLATCSGTYSGSTCTPPSAAVAFGNAIHDYANLTGLATEPGTNGASHGGNSNYPTINATGLSYAGSIKFTLNGPSASGCGTVTSNSVTLGDSNPQSVAVNSVTGNGVYGPVSYTPGAPGVYHWQATVDDLSNANPPVELSVNNTLPASEDNALCTDTNEDVTVQQIPTTISTTQKVYPEDSATITSSVTGDNIPVGGTVTFSLYGGGASDAANYANCQAAGTTGRIYTTSFSTNDGLNGHPAAAHSETFGTSQNTVAVSDNETVYWLVTYATGDQAHTGRQSSCAESTQTVFVNSTGDGTVFP
jgi:hypothetical protein